MGAITPKNNISKFKRVLLTIKDFCKDSLAPWFVRLYQRKLLLCVVSAVVINIIIELAGRRSFIGLFKHIFYNFHMFVFSVAVIALTLFISCLFRKRLFVYTVIAAIWLTLGISNGVILSYRSTPMIAIDFLIMRSSIGISTVYLSVVNLILIAVGIIAGVVLLVFIYKYSPKETRDISSACVPIACSGSIVAILACAFYFGNAVDSSELLPDIYNKCGYVYCLTYSVFDYGVDEPKAYNEKYMQQILDEVNKVEETKPDEMPNIVFLQLESYMDMSRIDGIELSQSPQPFFQQLKNDCPSGKLKVNALGASTANVEYEVLTGNYIKDFGFDEYPYKTFLYDTAVETIAYDLKALGYETTALHNHDGGFYSRYKAYKNLGFDRFISRETMNNIELTPTGWCKDSALIEEITKTMESSEGADFIFTVSVQCHSKYPKEILENAEYPITVSGFEDEGYINQLAYYASQVLEEDAFLEELLAYFEASDENTVVVIYGDHLPTFIKESTQLTEGLNSSTDTEKYISEYLIWSNYGIEKGIANKDLSSQELSSYILDCAGIRTGTVMRLYHLGLDEKTLASYRRAIAYDAIEGNRYIYKDNDIIKTIDMQMGRIPLTITSYDVDDGTLFVEGSGFSEYTDIYINGQLYTSSLVDSSTIRVAEEVKLNNGDIITAKINTFDRLELAKSNAYKVGNLNDTVVVNDGIGGFHKVIVVIITTVLIVLVLFITWVVYSKKKK